MRILSTLITIALCMAIPSLVPADVESLSIESISMPTTPKNIRVLIEKNASSALLEVQGSYLLINPQDGQKISSGLLSKRFMIHAIKNGLKWGEEFPGYYQLIMQPRSNDTSIFINGMQYSGNVAIYAVGDRINIVNELDIETYVKSILSAQVIDPLEAEVMAALAILARTNAYYCISKNLDAFWNVAAIDVGYQGSGLNAPESTAQRAVDSTRHLVLSCPKEGRALPFATAWTEHCAGKTASYTTMFRKGSFAPETSVAAPHAAIDRKAAKWSFTATKKALSRLLDVAEVGSVELFVDPNSNKVYGVRVKGGKDIQDFDFLSLQNRLGKANLQSSDFSVTINNDAIVFEGYGKGHGVGLCVYSATAMAQNGDNALKILAKFYPDTNLVNLNGLVEKKKF